MNDETQKANLTETATAQIDLANEADDRLDKNDRDWLDERQKLVDTPAQAPAPSPSLGPMPIRDLKAEYEAGLTRYEQNKSEIINDARQDRATIRENGTTLQSEFEATKTSQLELDFNKTSHDMGSIKAEFEANSIQGYDQAQSMNQSQSQGRSR